MERLIALVHVLSDFLTVAEVVKRLVLRSGLARQEFALQRPAANAHQFIRQAEVVFFAGLPPLGGHVLLELPELFVHGRN